tara:strand:- start:1696 stop:2793 length:1098 start_codon:yes stop_codon:yes gene_type:complete
MSKMTKVIPLDEPVFNGNEKKYVNECFKKGWISWQGSYVKKFQKKFSSIIGCKYALSTANGTDAIILALKALGIKRGDEVIVPSLTFSASVFAITEVGAKPVFIDVNSKSLDMDVSQIENKITFKTKAIMVVHLYGRPVQMDRLIQITKKHKIKVIEDCAESLGAKYKKRLTGSFSDISCFSFHNKLIATGEGGMILTNNINLFRKIDLLRNPAPDNRTAFNQVSLNSRMSNVNSAIGLGQLENLSKFVKKKRYIAKLYEKHLRELNEVEFFEEKKYSFASFWRHSILLKDGNKRLRLINFLKKKKIITRGIFLPMHLHPLYLRTRDFFPNSEYVSNSSIDIPSSVNLDESKIIYITNCIKDFFK